MQDRTSTTPTDPAYTRALARVRSLRLFYTHFAVYISINLGLLAINLVASPGRLWFYWSVLGWGIAVVLHAVATFAGGIFARDWEARKAQQLVEQERTPEP